MDLSARIILPLGTRFPSNLTKIYPTIIINVKTTDLKMNPGEFQTLLLKGKKDLLLLLHLHLGRQEINQNHQKQQHVTNNLLQTVLIRQVLRHHLLNSHQRVIN